MSTKKDPGFFFRAARVFLQGAEEKEVHGFEVWKFLKTRYEQNNTHSRFQYFARRVKLSIMKHLVFIFKASQEAAFLWCRNISFPHGFEGFEVGQDSSGNLKFCQVYSLDGIGRMIFERKAMLC